jgi:hypothetical protein
MYPIEKTLGKYKRYVQNKVRPEGLIAKCYLADECLTFCSMYLREVLMVAGKKRTKSWMCSVNKFDRWMQRNL